MNSIVIRALCALAVVCGTWLACQAGSSLTQLPVPAQVQAFHEIEDFAVPVAQFRTVFWEPQDTTSLRGMIRQTSVVRDKRVLEIGTGTGLVSLCCIRAGARRVVATDVNETAVRNAHYNAHRLGISQSIDIRLVPLSDTGAYSVIQPSEQFDLIISNPPWEDDKPDSIDEFALYDTDFALLRSLIEGVDQHLAPDGRVYLAYGCVRAIEEVIKLAEEHDLEVAIFDDRRPEHLPDVFLPGMLLELRREGNHRGAEDAGSSGSF